MTDNANRAIQGNEAMQVMQTGDQCKFATNGSGASWWPNLQSVQIAPSGDQNVQTLDEASYGGKIFYLQI